jgi:hypothetical protein
MKETTTPGVCEFCHVTDDQVDGCRLSWFDDTRTCCSKSGCIKARGEKARRRKVATPAPRRRTPADIHALIVEERKAKRKRYRDAAKAKGLLREKGAA